MPQIVDATGRGKPGQDIASHNGRFRTLIEQSPVSTALFSLEGRLQLYNQACLDLFGLDEAQIQEISTEYVIWNDPTLERLGLLQLLKRAFAGESVVVPPTEYHIGTPISENGLKLDSLRHEALWFAGRYFPLFDDDGNVTSVVTQLEDITDRVLAKRSLAESESRLRSIFEASSDGIALSDNARTIAANPAYVKLFGYSDELEVLGTPFRFRIAKGERDRVSHFIYRKLRGDDEADVIETRGRRKDGSTFDLEVRVSISQSSGRPLLVGIHRDVSERNRALKELRESEERYRTVVDGSSEGIALISLTSGLFEFVNPALEVFLGVPEGKLVGSKADAILTESKSGERGGSLDQLREGEDVFEREQRCPRPDGRLVFADISATPLDLDGRPYAVAFVRDVTERLLITEFWQRTEELERSQELLAEQTEKLKMATRAARIGIWIWDIKRDQLSTDAVVQELYGVTEAGLSEDLGSWNRNIHRDDRPRVLQALDEALASHGDFDESYRLVHPGGETRHAKVTGVVIRSADGDPLRMVGTSIDITEAKRREAELLEAKQRAEESTRSKSIFLASMSHEIRTPLNTILGYSQLLGRDQALSSDHRRLMEVIHQSGDHLLTLIDDILAMSKIEAGRVDFLSEPFAIARILRDIEMMFAENCRRKGLKLQLDIEPSMPKEIVGDAGKVRQVLLNLMGNAVKFTERGSISISARSEKITDSLVRIDVEVEDTGCGISPGGLDRIFGLFDQLESGQRLGGTGLGLTISRKFARMMGGEIHVESEAGKGSRFTFSFQAKLSCGPSLAQQPQTSGPRRLPPDEHPRRVLIVDDVDTNREILSSLVRQAGLKTVEASSGPEARSLIRQEPPDLVLMDLQMPNVDGFETIRALRDDGWDFPIVAVTASVLWDVRLAALRAGADAFVPKPVVEADLLRVFENLLNIEFEEISTAERNYGDAEERHESSLASDREALPQELIEAIRRAARAAHFDRLMVLAAEAGTYSEAVTHRVMELVCTFQYDRLLAELDEEVIP